MAEAFGWSSRITTVALEMALPGAIGAWVDEQLDTGIVFVVLGVILGMTTGMFHLTRMIAADQRRSSSTDTLPDDTTPDHEADDPTGSRK